ncbi:MAG: TetR/AcrR family transcriptional regulator [Balneolia bacterium]|nr:TetR/AcrR family transcriptional regulator [Balneolia bacterium]
MTLDSSKTTSYPAQGNADADTSADSTPLRRQILDESRSMLLEVGFDRMSMRKIATNVGCSATSIYIYFKNKDDLLHALIEEGFEMLFGELMKLPSMAVYMDRYFSDDSGKNRSDDSASDPFNQLEDLCRTFVRFGMENREYYEIMFQLHPKHMRRYPVEKYRKARKNIDVIMNVLESGNEQDLFHIPGNDARLVANVILSTLHGGISLMNAGRIDNKVDKDAYVETIIHSVLAGVRSKGAQK